MLTSHPPECVNCKKLSADIVDLQALVMSGEALREKYKLDWALAVAALENERLNHNINYGLLQASLKDERANHAKTQSTMQTTINYLQRNIDELIERGRHNKRFYEEQLKESKK